MKIVITSKGSELTDALRENATSRGTRSFGRALAHTARCHEILSYVWHSLRL